MKAQDTVRAEARRQAAKNPFYGGGDYINSSYGRTVIMTTRADGCEARAHGSIHDAVFISLAKLDRRNVPVVAGCGYVSNSDPSEIHVKWVDQEDFETMGADGFSKIDTQKLEDSGDLALASAFQFIK
jgi:hypothetical protein